MKKWIFPILLVLVLGGGIWWRLSLNAAAKQGPGAAGGQRGGGKGRAASVELAKPQFRDIINTFEATGSVEAVQNVKITPKMTGQITLLTVREGDRVHAGQVLIRLDQAELQAQLRAAQANLAQSKYRLAQAQITQSSTDMSVIAAIRQQEAAVATAEANLHQAQQARVAQLEAVKATIDDAGSKVDNAHASVSNANATIKSAQANLDNASVKYNRVYDLYKQGYVAAQDVDDAKTTVSVQQAQVDTAKGQLQAAQANLASIQAQKRSVEQQGAITRAKVDTDVEVASAQLSQARALLENAKANAKQTPAYQQNLAALQAAVDVAQATVDNAKANLDDAVLKSPLDGVVTARSMDPGSIASPSQPVLTVQAINSVWVTLSVPEEVVAKLHLSQPVDVTFDALGGKTIKAAIAQINPSADVTSRQYTVRVLMNNANRQLSPGMFGRVNLVTDRAAHILAVPREAVEDAPDGSKYVFVAMKGTPPNTGKGNGADAKPAAPAAKPEQAPAEAPKATGAGKTGDTAAPGSEKKGPPPMYAQKRVVTIGISDAAWISITSGLQPEELVVTMSAMPLRDNQVITTGGGAGKGGRGGKGGKGKPDGALQAGGTPGAKPDGAIPDTAAAGTAGKPDATAASGAPYGHGKPGKPGGTTPGDAPAGTPDSKPHGASPDGKPRGASADGKSWSGGQGGAHHRGDGTHGQAGSGQ